MSESLQRAYSDLAKRVKQATDSVKQNYDIFGLDEMTDENIVHQKEAEAYLNAQKNTSYYSPRYQTTTVTFGTGSGQYYDLKSFEELNSHPAVMAMPEVILPPGDFIEYAEAVKKEPMEDKNWLNEYKDNIMSRNSSSKRRQKPKYARTMFRGKTFTVNSLLDTYELIRNKEVGDIAITGSLSLFLQGKISRNKLGDLDLSTRSGNIQLDDDFEDVIMDMHYGEFGEEELVAAPRMYYFNNVLVDIFPEEKVIPETLYIEYKGKEYLCVDYRHILDAKLEMLLPRMKDFKELYNKVFELNFI